MDESEWLRTTEPEAMLSFLRDNGLLSDRKAQLFAVACCRCIWPWLTDERSRTAVEVAERHAEGQADVEEVMKAWGPACEVANEAHKTTLQAEPPASPSWDVESVAMAARHALAGAPLAAANAAWGASASGRGGTEAPAGDAEKQRQADLVRDLFGPLPFRSPPLSAAVLTWNDGLVARLAQAAYDERHLPEGRLDGQRLAVLADALEEAGADAELVAHLRAPGPHYRGCWVVDALTGKEVPP